MRSRAKWYVTVFVLLGSAAAVLPDEGAAIDPAWLAKTQTELKAVREKNDALSLHLEQVYEIRADKVPGGPGTSPAFEPHTRRERMVRLGDNMIVDAVRILDSDPNHPLIRLDCDNSDYHFTLTRQKEDAPHVLADYNP